MKLKYYDMQNENLNDSFDNGLIDEKKDNTFYESLYKIIVIEIY